MGGLVRRSRFLVLDSYKSAITQHSSEARVARVARVASAVGWSPPSAACEARDCGGSIAIIMYHRSQTAPMGPGDVGEG